jgi:hypothetical protein
MVHELASNIAPLCVASIGAGFGALCVGALGAYLVACARSERLRAATKFRWGRTGKGAPVSAFGYVAWALNAFGWAAVCALSTLNPTPHSHMLLQWVLLGYMIAAFVVLAVAAFNDW